MMLVRTGWARMVVDERWDRGRNLNKLAASEGD